MIVSGRLRFLKTWMPAALSFLLASIPAFAQFTSFTSENSALSYNAVHAIAEDSRGFIWIGTSYGLNRFDGVNFHSYFKEDLGVNSNYISFIYEDSRSNIWIGTDFGLSVYDFKLGRFLPLETVTSSGVGISNKVRYIREDSVGRIWCAVNESGIFSYDPQTDILENHLYDPETGIELPANISCFIFDSEEKNILISTYFRGVYTVPLDFSRAPEPFCLESDPDYFLDDNVMDMIVGHDNTIFAASVHHGLCEIMPRSSRIRTIIPKDSDKFYPYDICLSYDDKLYMATNVGLYIYDIHSGETVMERTTNKPGSPHGIRDRRTIYVTVDSSGGIWLGSENGGVAYKGPLSANFKRYQETDDGESLSGALIWDFAEDESGNIWITTDSKGLLRLSGGKLEKYECAGLPEQLLGICCADGLLWMGTNEGVIRLDPVKHGFRKYKPDELEAKSLNDRSIFSVCNTDCGNILFGHSLGMVEYDPTTDSFVTHHELDGVNIGRIVNAGDGQIWLSTYAHGIIHYDLTNRRIAGTFAMDPDDSSSLPINKLLDLYRDRSGRIWACTFGAGCYVLEESGERKVFNNSNTGGKIGSDVIDSIREDSDGTLWVATADGLTSISRDLSTLSRYTTSDGILSNKFNNHSSFAASDGNLYFGCFDGFISLNPRDFVREEKTPELHITEMCINGKTVIAGEGGILDDNIDATRKVVLKHHQNNFSFEFSLPGLVSPSGSFIMCKLDGFDKSWHQAGEGNIYHWQNVPGGKYRLLSTGYAADGSWDEHRPLTIVVRAPLLRSKVASVLYAVICLALLVVCALRLYRRLISRERERQKAEIEALVASTPERRLLRAAEMGQAVYPLLLQDGIRETDKRFISKVDEFIDAHVEDDRLSGDFVAGELHIGVQSLNLKTKKIIGMTVNDYVRLVRLCYAVRLLREDDVRINEVCYRVGFNTPSYFAKCFRTCFGILPADYRKEFLG